MLNRSASLAMSTSVLKALPGKLDIKRHSPSILYIFKEICDWSEFSGFHIDKSYIFISELRILRQALLRNLASKYLMKQPILNQLPNATQRSTSFVGKPVIDYLLKDGNYN